MTSEHAGETPALSVVVPVYNVERYLEQCLSSLAAQTFRDVEFICVNDGSTDRSPEILRGFAARDARFRIIDKPNSGYGASMNRGIAVARGRYLGIVESDDFVEPDMFEVLMGRVLAHDLDMVRAGYWYYWGEPEPRNQYFESFKRPVADRVFNPRDLEECFFFPPALWSLVVRREMVESHGLRFLETPGAAYQDTSFSFKLWACAQRAELVYEPYLHYRQDNESSSINNRAKVGYVAGEIAETERFCREDLADPTLLPLVNRRRYDSYLWNLRRIDPSLRLEFAERGAREFAQARAAGELRRDLFSRSEWRRIETWCTSPEALLRDVEREDRSLVTAAKRTLLNIVKRG